MKDKVLPFPVAKAPGGLEAMRVGVQINHWHYGRLVRVAALFETSINDVLERLLEKEFGKGTEPQPPNSRAA